MKKTVWDQRLDSTSAFLIARRERLIDKLSLDDPDYEFKRLKIIEDSNIVIASVEVGIKQRSR